MRTGELSEQEWADLIEELIPEDALRISIAYGSSEEERIYTCTY